MMPPTERPLAQKQRAQTAHGPRTDVRSGVAIGAHGRYIGGGGGGCGGGGGGVRGGASGASAETQVLAAVAGKAADGEVAAGESIGELVARATRKRREATALLEGAEVLAPSSSASGGEEEASSVDEAQLAVQLACAYKELGQWEAAEKAYLKAIPALEDARGHSDDSVLDLWLEVIAIHMQLHRYDDAAINCEHVLNMTRLTKGPGSADLIPIAEKLAKAHVLARRWPEARDALTEAHTVSSGRFGPEHRDTLRIADVLKSVDKYAPPHVASTWTPWSL